MRLRDWVAANPDAAARIIDVAQLISEWLDSIEWSDFDDVGLSSDAADLPRRLGLGFDSMMLLDVEFLSGEEAIK